MAVKTSTIYTTTDGSDFKKKTIANRHQRYLDAKAILDEETAIEETQVSYLDLITRLGSIQEVMNVLKDYQLGSQF